MYNFFYKPKIFIFCLLTSFLFCSIQSKEQGIKKIEDQFEKTFSEMKYSKSGNLLIHSNKLNIHIKKSIGYISDEKVKSIPNQPFHIASIGKVFTSTLFYILLEEKKIILEDKISKYLNEDTLKDLFVFEKKDYSDEVRIIDLLNHRSGINDYLESSSKNENSALNSITKNPNKFWTVKDILDYTRNNLKAVSKPNEKFYYSDTGYILLGMILEKIEKKKLEQILLTRIFKPFGLKNTYMYLKSDPIEKNDLKLSRMFLEDKEVTGFKSLSLDWAGGGLVSTIEDLLKFQESLIEGKIISKKNYESMKGNDKFLDMIFYGKGLMTLKLNELSFLLPKIPELHGHSGLLSTFMFYIPEYDTHIIANFGSTGDIEKSFEMFIWICLNLKEINELNIKQSKI